MIYTEVFLNKFLLLFNTYSIASSFEAILTD